MPSKRVQHHSNQPPRRSLRLLAKQDTQQQHLVEHLSSHLEAVHIGDSRSSSSAAPTPLADSPPIASSTTTTTLVHHPHLDQPQVQVKSKPNLLTTLASPFRKPRQDDHQHPLDTDISDESLQDADFTPRTKYRFMRWLDKKIRRDNNNVLLQLDAANKRIQDAEQKAAEAKKHIAEAKKRIAAAKEEAAAAKKEAAEAKKHANLADVFKAIDDLCLDIVPRKHQENRGVKAYLSRPNLSKKVPTLLVPDTLMQHLCNLLDNHLFDTLLGDDPCLDFQLSHLQDEVDRERGTGTLEYEIDTQRLVRERILPYAYRIVVAFVSRYKQRKQALGSSKHPHQKHLKHLLQLLPNLDDLDMWPTHKYELDYTSKPPDWVLPETMTKAAAQEDAEIAQEAKTNDKMPSPLLYRSDIYSIVSKSPDLKACCAITEVKAYTPVSFEVLQSSLDQPATIQVEQLGLQDDDDRMVGVISQCFVYKLVVACSVSLLTCLLSNTFFRWDFDQQGAALATCKYFNVSVKTNSDGSRGWKGTRLTTALVAGLLIGINDAHPSLMHEKVKQAHNTWHLAPTVAQMLADRQQNQKGKASTPSPKDDEPGQDDDDNPPDDGRSHDQTKKHRGSGPGAGRGTHAKSQSARGSSTGAGRSSKATGSRKRDADSFGHTGPAVLQDNGNKELQVNLNPLKPLVQQSSSEAEEEQGEVYPGCAPADFNPPTSNSSTPESSWGSKSGDRRLGSQGSSSYGMPPTPRDSSAPISKGTDVVEIALDRGVTSSSFAMQQGQEEKQEEQQEEAEEKEMDDNDNEEEEERYALRSDKLLTSRFCTTACLLGLKLQSEMDPQCPNIHLHCRDSSCLDHSKHNHTLSIEQLKLDIQAHLARGKILHLMEPILGSRGSGAQLFRLIHPEQGYAFAAKGLIDFAEEELVHEHEMYECMWEQLPKSPENGYPELTDSHQEVKKVRIQVPISFGVVKPTEQERLRVMYPLWPVEGQIECGLVCNTFLLLSYHGKGLEEGWDGDGDIDGDSDSDVDNDSNSSIVSDLGSGDAARELRRIKSGKKKDWLEEKCRRALLKRCKIRHGDLYDLRNLLWCPQLRSVVIIDFANAVITDAMDHRPNSERFLAS